MLSEIQSFLKSISDHTELERVQLPKISRKFETSTSLSSSEEESLYSKQIDQFIQHFKQDDPVGLGIDIPDPSVGISLVTFVLYF